VVPKTSRVCSCQTITLTTAFLSNENGAENAETKGSNLVLYVPQSIVADEEEPLQHVVDSYWYRKTAVQPWVTATVSVLYYEVVQQISYYGNTRELF
jgi:hypothetical protein